MPVPGCLPGVWTVGYTTLLLVILHLTLPHLPYLRLRSPHLVVGWVGLVSWLLFHLLFTVGLLLLPLPRFGWLLFTRTPVVRCAVVVPLAPLPYITWIVPWFPSHTVELDPTRYCLLVPSCVYLPLVPGQRLGWLFPLPPHCGFIWLHLRVWLPPPQLHLDIGIGWFVG